MTAVIETAALTKSYGESRGIEDLSLEVPKGEIFGFLGPNGAGKTTTIRTLLDLLHPTSGRALLFGLDSHSDSRAIRARIGNLPGDFAYEDRTTGNELLSLFARLRGMDGLGSAADLAERFRADLTKPLRELSRGNRQKIGLIQALFHNPELLILDEPTGGLDPLMQEEFLTVVAEHRDQGATVFLSSHDLSEVERICDRVGIIRAGRLAAIESVGEMKGRAYRKVKVSLASPVEASGFESLPGVDSVSVDGHTLRLRVLGDINPLLEAIAKLDVRDLEVTAPSLEELFLQYYDVASEQ